MNRLFHFLLLVLFALLQCVAPIAHAHVNGDNVDQNVHITISKSSELADADSGATHLSVGASHSPVICMPPEYKGDGQTITQHFVASDQRVLLLAEHIAPTVATSQSHDYASPRYQRPYSQAPPA